MVQSSPKSCQLQDQQNLTITWSRCADLPPSHKVSFGHSVVISGNVYVTNGFVWGAHGDNVDNDYIVLRYSLLQDEWTMLPALPVRQPGLGHVGGKLVAIGGWKTNGQLSKKVYTFDEESKTWKQTIPYMPTAKISPTVLSLESALVVAGFKSMGDEAIEIVIFKPMTSRWYKIDPSRQLGINVIGFSMVAFRDRCCVLGGLQSGQFEMPNSNTFCAAIDDITQSVLDKAPEAVWDKLPTTPMHGSAAAVVSDELFALGGRNTFIEDEVNVDTISAVIHKYDPSSESWMRYSDLPLPLFGATVAVLAPSEILVIGGHSESDSNAYMNNYSVYKGKFYVS